MIVKKEYMRTILMFQEISTDFLSFYFLVFPKGLHLLRTYMRNTFEPVLNSFGDVLSSKVEYKVNVTGKNYKAESSLLINDVTNASTQKIALHWLSAEFPKKETFSLIANHGGEVRKYNLLFKCNNNIK